MTKDELRTVIDSIVIDAFKRIEYAYRHHQEKFDNIISNGDDIETQTRTRLVFPKYSDKKDDKRKEDVRTRISEQELRFAFVEAFNSYCENHLLDLYYSIETPTTKKYLDFSTNPKVAVTKEEKEKGRSGEFDMVIFNNDLKRICLIEFKANNSDKIDHEKDLLKLIEEGNDILCYFIEIIKSYTKGNEETKTIGSLKRKFKLNNERGETMIRCYALEGQSQKSVKGENISDIFNELILHHNNTGINAVIKVSHMRPEKNPCILVETKAGRVSITIEDEPIANESCRLDNTTLSCLRKWIVLNKDILLAYWNDDLYPTSQLLHQIKKLS